MANDCMSTIEFKVSQAGLDLLHSMMDDKSTITEFFSRFLPTSNKDDIEKVISTLGCKWDPDLYFGDIVYSDPELEVHTLWATCDTPWSPPLDGLANLFDKSDWLHFVGCKYFEPGADFAGEWDCETGISDEFVCSENKEPLDALFGEGTWAEWFEMEDESDELCSRTESPE